MGKKMRLPNAYGSVYKLSGNRRKPFAVAITIGWDKKGRQLRKIIDTAETRSKGLDILADYHTNNNKYTNNYKNITIEKTFEMLNPILVNSVEKCEMSQSNYNSLLSAYRTKLDIIYKNKIVDLKKRQLQDIIDNSNVGHTSRGYIKNLLCRIFTFAIDDLELDVKNIAINLEVGEKPKSTKHLPFNIELLDWMIENHMLSRLQKIIWIFLHTGLRPKELLEIKSANVFLKENYMIGGCKTKAGKDRIIPIHPDIKEVIEEFYNENNEYLITMLDSNKKMSNDYYYRRFVELINDLGFKNTPYDTRHTFATYADMCGIDPIALKLILGHSLENDVTNNVYIHKSIEFLFNEIKKLSYKDVLENKKKSTKLTNS